MLEDGNHTEGAAQLAQLRDVHTATDSSDGLAMALEGYAELAETFPTELQALKNFPLAITDESLMVARALREHSVLRKAGGFASDQRNALALRNRLLGAMMNRVGSARRAIRYVFRDDPVLLKQASSDYERRRRTRNGNSEVVPSGNAAAADPLAPAAKQTTEKSA